MCHSIYVIDMWSAHGTFVANERLTKDSPVEIEVGQSLQFAARKNNAALFPSPPKPTLIELPYPPDPSDEEAVLLLTHVNRPLKGLTWPDIVSKSSRPSSSSGGKDDSWLNERARKRIRRTRFRDQVGGSWLKLSGSQMGLM